MLGITQVVNKIPASFLSSADNNSGCNSIKIGEQFIRHSPTSFYLRMIDDTMLDAGIFPGDILVIDRNNTPQSGDIVVAYFNQAYIVKRFINYHDSFFLVPENPKYPSIEIETETDLIISGVVIFSVRDFS